jgi:tetratricopeptide (TPR) repeat protein
MKIAVATIAKNEEQFVKRWAESCADADYRLILDTGSTDGSHEQYRETFAGHETTSVAVNKTFDPWRFDNARNHALSLIPDNVDYVIWLDMDELLTPGWRKALETFLKENPTVNRPRYKYVWSWKEDGTEGLTYAGDKIHSRSDYRWKHPVHEVLKPLNGERQGFVPGLEIHHHPDHFKSRSQYLPLLEMAVAEDPDDDRNQFYLAREYYFHGQFDKASEHFHNHIKLSNWMPEVAASYRYLAKIEPDKGNQWLLRACSIDPSRRESWVALADYYHQQKMWQSCRDACFNALSIETKPLDYLCEELAWGERAADLMALSCHKLGLKEQAIMYGELAVELNPNDERLQTNLSFYRL